jgi:hypothetical protein
MMSICFKERGVYLLKLAIKALIRLMELHLT